MQIWTKVVVELLQWIFKKDIFKLWLSLDVCRVTRPVVKPNVTGTHDHAFRRHLLDHWATGISYCLVEPSWIVITISESNLNCFVYIFILLFVIFFQVCLQVQNFLSMSVGKTLTYDYDETSGIVAFVYTDNVSGQ